ncbi:MAG: diadenylate cyclase CdaA [Acutalibacteraceae bacterium]|nr:diadenylate cyclase CdaA [Acutalibacteraceae bacterium]
MSSIFNAIYAFFNQIIYAVASMRVSDIVDILIMAFIIYKAIGFMRESRAGQLAKGLIVLFLIYFIANWWNLATMKWVLSRFVNYIIVALAIIFQPELRRILERVGHTKLVGTQGDLTDEPMENCIDKVCRAAGNMQENRIGALVVFERSTQLGEIINTGTVINADPSVSMVGNIFFPKSPLHDGAMIIRDGRLYAAGCILPLTQREDISSQLGTRHRAAIGMTENSDAVVLVVSEETGIISIVSNGKIERNYNSISAAEELRRLLIDGDKPQSDSKLAAILKRCNPFKKAHGKDDEKADETENNTSC